MEGNGGNIGAVCCCIGTGIDIGTGNEVGLLTRMSLMGGKLILLELAIWKCQVLVCIVQINNVDPLFYQNIQWEQKGWFYTAVYPFLGFCT